MIIIEFMRNAGVFNQIIRESALMNFGFKSFGFLYKFMVLLKGLSL